MGGGCRQPPHMTLLTQVEDEPGLHLALLDVFETLVHLVQLADLADHPGAPLGVQPEHLIEVGAVAHDRAEDRDSVEDGLEDRQLDCVIRGQGDEDQLAAAA